MNEKTKELLIAIRKEFHAHPEVSSQEYATQQRILEFLKTHTKANFTEIAETGILATFDGGNHGPTIMIRGDIDALPIQEINTFAHHSKTEGISHKCGHDGHTAILLGLALQLEKKPITRGKVLLLFQPAEENGMGAQSVLEDSNFQKNKIDYVLALHNLPGIEKHEIVVKENEFTANVKSIIIKLHGKTAHAAEPEFGHNPATATAEILQYAEKHTHNQADSPGFFLVTPVCVSLGEKAYGISAGYGELHLTIRSWSTDLMNKKCAALERFIEKKCEQHHLTPEVSWTQIFYANLNHPETVRIIKEAAKQNKLKIIEASTPFKWGEDFGLFTQQFKGAMFGIGAGKNTPALHNPDYDFPDDITPTGVAMFNTIINQILRT